MREGSNKIVTGEPIIVANCITRDAQNVYDKKRSRYEKIQQMRKAKSPTNPERQANSDFMLNLQGILRNDQINVIENDTEQNSIIVEPKRTIKKKIMQV